LFALAQRRHPLAQLLERQEVLLIGSEHALDALAHAHEIALHSLFALFRGVGGARGSEPPIEFVLNQRRILEQPNDLGPDDLIQQILSHGSVVTARAAEVARGRSVVVCPEGTRGYEYSLRPFKKGPFVLAIAAKAPVVPVVVYGAREVMRKGSFRVRSGTVHIHFLDAVETTGLDYDRRHEVMRKVWDRMAALLRGHYGVGTTELAIEPEADPAIAPSAEHTA